MDQHKAAGSVKGEPSKPSWIAKRLMTMAELRGAPFPSTDALKAISSALSGFTQQVIEEACSKLERAAVADYEPRMPTLQKLEDACREASQPRTKLRDCSVCANDRWIIVEREGRREAIRCECWTSRQAAV